LTCCTSLGVYIAQIEQFQIRNIALVSGEGLEPTTP
jgi:hypothetical protein